MTTFGNQIGSEPITSYFFYQRDDNLTRTAVCNSWSVFYAYDNSTDTWTSTQTGLNEYETIPGLTTHRTRRDYAVYKNIIYMGNGVDPYASYDGTTYTQIWVSSVGTCTFTNATDVVNLTSHSLVLGDNVKFTTTGTLPAEITAGQYYYVAGTVNPNDFQISTSPWGTVLDFTDDGTATTTCFNLTVPRVRYVSFLADRIYSAGDDGTPITMYVTDALPADATDINQNAIIVGGDETWKINGISEIGSIILAYKSNKIYSIDVDNGNGIAIDAQGGGYSDRAIQNVENSLVYFSDRGIDTLTQRAGVTGSAALTGKPLGEDIRQLTSQIEEFQYNSSASRYIKGLNNYYFSFDTNNDNRPDTTLVYNSATGGWTQYEYPNLYDYGIYIDSSQEVKYLISSATGWQMFEIETGFDDNGVAIPYELETKRFDFNTPGLNKDFDYVDVIGLKRVGFDIQVQAKVDWETASEGFIDDDMIDVGSTVKVLGTRPIGIVSLWWPQQSQGVPVYRFRFRLPMYSMWSDIAVNMQSTGGLRILEQMRISREGEPVDVFNYQSIG